MTWLCLACGNKEEFKGYCNGTCSYTERAYFDGEGSVTETTDCDYDNYDGNDSEVEECGVCGSCDIQCFDTKEEADEAYKLNKKPKTLMSLEVKDDS